MLRVLIVVLAAALILAVVAVLVLLRDPGAARRRVEALFRRPERPARPLEADHYYRPYWS